MSSIIIKHKKKRNLILLISLLLIAIALTSCTTKSQPVNLAGQVSPASIEWAWVPTQDNILTGGSYAYFPLGGASVQAGSILTLSWRADGSLEGFILTENQYDNFKQSGMVSARMAYGSGSSKSISVSISNTDRYYAIVRNTFTLGSSVKLYEAVLTEKY